MITLTLTDSTDSDTLQLPEAPLTTNVVEGAVDVQKLNNNISTYFTANKRQWVHTWAYMSKEDYLTVKGYYDRQWTLYKYPLLSIAGIENPVTNVPVRMYLPSGSIIDDCETYSSVQVTWRETEQM